MFREHVLLEGHFGAYAKDFDASKIPDDEVEQIDSTQSLEPMLDFHEKYGCEICEDGIFNLKDDGFDNTPEQIIEMRKFLIYRHPYMKKVGKKQACPECYEEEVAKKAVTSTSILMTKTNAKKEFKLSKDQIATLNPKKQTIGEWGLTSLYSRSECEKLGREIQEKKDREKEEKERKKVEEKEKKEEEKKRRREEKEASSAKSTTKSPKKKTDDSRVEPYSKSPAK